MSVFIFKHFPYKVNILNKIATKRFNRQVDKESLLPNEIPTNCFYVPLMHS